MKEVLHAVTGGKMALIEDAELDELLLEAEFIDEAVVSQVGDVAGVRDLTAAAARSLDFAEDRVYDLALCASEAATNALKHAGGGHVVICRHGDGARIWVRDRGAGIDCERLPRSTLWKGWSTKRSLGIGFSVLIELLDRLWLCTGRDGTVVGMDMDRVRHANDLMWLNGVAD